MKKKMVFVTTCAKSKRGKLHPSLRVSDLPDWNQEAIRAEWQRRLEAARAIAVSPEELYRGALWNRSLAAVEVARQRGFDVTFGICSAGYGLVWGGEGGDRLKRYEATFAPGSPDSIETPAKWWKALSGWGGREPGRPRSFVELVQQNPDAIIIVALSGAYMKAVVHDLVSSLVYLRDPENMMIVCTGAAKKGPLTDYMLPVGGSRMPASEIRQRIGGGFVSINPGVVEHVLRRHPEGEFTRSSVCRLLWGYV